jgi:hypothetical protein
LFSADGLFDCYGVLQVTSLMAPLFREVITTDVSAAMVDRLRSQGFVHYLVLVKNGLGDWRVTE